MPLTLHENGHPHGAVSRFVRQGESCTFELPAGTSISTGSAARHALVDDTGDPLPIHIAQVTGGIGNVRIRARFE